MRAYLLNVDHYSWLLHLAASVIVYYVGISIPNDNIEEYVFRSNMKTRIFWRVVRYSHLNSEITFFESNLLLLVFVS